jgi:hypothetical protein
MAVSSLSGIGLWLNHLFEEVSRTRYAYMAADSRFKQGVVNVLAFDNNLSAHHDGWGLGETQLGISHGLVLLAWFRNKLDGLGE